MDVTTSFPPKPTLHGVIKRGFTLLATPDKELLSWDVLTYLVEAFSAVDDKSDVKEREGLPHLAARDIFVAATPLIRIIP
jgi:hypothetical protein